MAKNTILRKLDLPANDWKSILKGAGLAALGAAVTFGTAAITDADFGEYTYLIVPAVTIILNVIRKVVFNDPLNVIGLSDGETKEIEWRS